MTIAVGAILFAPHVAWLVAQDFAPFTYAVVAHQSTFASAALSGFRFLVGRRRLHRAGGRALGTGDAPGMAAIADTLWPRAPDTAFHADRLYRAAAAADARCRRPSRLTSSRSGPCAAMTLLPVVLLSSPLVTVARRTAVWLLAPPSRFPRHARALAPFIAIWIHREGVPNLPRITVCLPPRWTRPGADDRQPLRFLGSYTSLINGVSFYLPGRSDARHRGPADTPWAARRASCAPGIALVCPDPEAICMHFLDARAGGVTRHAVTLSRTHWGSADKPVHYVIAIVPPKP